MAKFEVTFIQNWNYTVEADSEDEAFDSAFKDFLGDMRCAVATTCYDDCEIKCVDEERDSDEDSDHS